MKKAILSLLCTVFLLFENSCDNGNKKTVQNDSAKRDTNIYDITRPIGNFYLEDLLDIKSEEELKSKFGGTHVTYDTIWGEEGFYTMGTFLDEKTKDEVEFMWSDSAGRSGLENVRVTALFSDNNYSDFGNKWISKTGVKLGMTMDELEKINGKPFTFSGFGWDYGGGVMDWNKGALDNANVAVTLTEGNSTEKLSEKEMNQVMGDQDVKSDNAVVKKIQPEVVQLSVRK